MKLVFRYGDGPWVNRDGTPAEAPNAIVVSQTAIRPIKPAFADGPGTELKKLLAKLRIFESPGCSCNSMARKMNENGAQWCRENIGEILGVMQKEAAKRKLPFMESVARLIVLRAIRNAEKAATTPSPAAHLHAPPVQTASTP